MPTSNAPVTHSRCRCAACGEVFSVVSNFDKHRKNGECLDPASVGMELKVGYCVTINGKRGVWARPDPYQANLDAEADMANTLYPNNDIPIAELRALLAYNPDTGCLRWKKRPLSHFKNAGLYSAWNARHAGRKAGTASRRSRDMYIYVIVKGKRRFAHRIAYAIFYGEWPEQDIDHLDGDGTNNRICNLRLADSVLNGRNSRMHRSNTSGHVGVRWHKRDRKWESVIRVNYKQVYLGYFDNLSEAVHARKEAERRFGGFTERHGKLAQAQLARCTG